MKGFKTSIKCVSCEDNLNNWNSDINLISKNSPVVRVFALQQNGCLLEPHSDVERKCLDYLDALRKAVAEKEIGAEALYIKLVQSMNSHIEDMTQIGKVVLHNTSGLPIATHVLKKNVFDGSYHIFLNC